MEALIKESGRVNSIGPIGEFKNNVGDCYEVLVPSR